MEIEDVQLEMKSLISVQGLLNEKSEGLNSE